MGAQILCISTFEKPRKLSWCSITDNSNIMAIIHITSFIEKDQKAWSNLGQLSRYKPSLMEKRRFVNGLNAILETWELGLFALCSGAQNLIIGLEKITEKPFHVLCPSSLEVSLSLSLSLLLLLLTLFFERKAIVRSSSWLVLKTLWLYFRLGDQFAVG